MSLAELFSIIAVVISFIAVCISFLTFIDNKFQLTRSVGSVTLHIVYVKSHHHNRADILLKITLKSNIFYIICIIFSANLHIKPISLHVRSQNQTALRIICFLCTYMLHSPLPIIT